MEFVAIIDVHARNSSNVRTDVDYIGNICNKLEFVIEKANEWDATIIMAGDFFDTPTQPDIVKTKVANILLKAKYKPITIYGNHCTIFANEEYNYKTSTHHLHTTGVWKALQTGDDFIFEKDGQKCKIAVTRPLINASLPQIGLYHGFLNQIDGPNTFLFEDIETDDNCVIVLGHDHVPQEPVKYKNSTIHRPGSLVRGIRNDSEQRIPQLIRIRLKEDNTWAVKYYDIPCIDSSLIFKEKKAKADKVNNDYQSIINQIKETSSSNLTLEKALGMVTNKETVMYLTNIKDELENNRASK